MDDRRAEKAEEERRLTLVEELLLALEGAGSQARPNDPPRSERTAAAAREDSPPYQADPKAHLQSISLRGYKCLRHLDVHLAGTNIFTGPNNSGKSTLLGALQILDAGIRTARRVRPTSKQTPDGTAYCYSVATERLTTSTENVHTDLADIETTVRFRFRKGYELTLWFPSDGGCYFYVSECEGRIPRSPKTFRDLVDINVRLVPVLGPLEHDEPLLQQATVDRNLATHRAARNFRNYWHHYPDAFEKFAELISSTWPGVTIEAPELTVGQPPTLHMFCQEDRITRELYWMGFGFQVWCQLLTHVSRAGSNDLLVIDEPETYLHPVIQRQLLGILRGTGAQLLVATHSAPIVMGARPHEVFNIRRRARTARPERRPSRTLAFQLGLLEDT